MNNKVAFKLCKLKAMSVWKLKLDLSICQHLSFSFAVTWQLVTQVTKHRRYKVKPTGSASPHSLITILMFSLNHMDKMHTEDPVLHDKCHLGSKIYDHILN